MKPGISVQRLAVATNRNSVPRNARYFSGSSRPTSSICFSMPVTIISSSPCQREMAAFGRELARDQLRAQRHRDHHGPGRHDGAVELHKAVLPENLLVGGEIHWQSFAQSSGIFPQRHAREPRHHDARHEEPARQASKLAPVARATEIETRQVQWPFAPEDCRRTKGRLF